MNWHIAPENDYRGVLSLDQGVEPTVAVVIPVYNRVDLLLNAISGLVAQTYPADLFEVIVADDGSDEDVAAAVADLSTQLRVTVLRQEHDGYGAGRARNMGAGHSTAEVLIFIDADCVPDPELVTQHVAWHRCAANLVVIGSRHHLDTSDISRDDLVAGSAELRSLATGSADATTALVPDDFRRVFYRRTAGLRTGDEAFRSLVSSNFSIRSDRFVAVGGFSEDFNRWGGEDTELGWRLFNAGLLFVPENAAAIYHQTQQDGGDTPDWRDTARTANDGIIQAKIPHRFYRKSERGYIYEVPKVTWIVSPTIADRATELWEQILRQSFTDLEVLFLGGEPVVDRLGEMLGGDPRIKVIPAADSADDQLRTALVTSRGEYVALLHGWASLDHRLLSRAVRRLDANPRSSIVRCGYQVVTGEGEASYLYDEAINDLDEAWQPDGLPVFALTRRREWAKLANARLSIGAMWREVRELSDTRALRDAMVAVPSLTANGPLPDHFPPITGERSHFVDDVTKGGSKRAAKAVGRFAVAKAMRKPYRPVGLNTATSGRLPPQKAASSQPGVTYIGWLGRQNFGDEVMLAAVQQLLPDATVGYDVADRRLLMLGGGTLINRLTYLEVLRRHDSPRLERVVFGTGVADPIYWDLTEPTEGWVDYLDSCSYVGVRGPRSEALLREWGFGGEMEILGDPGLSIQPATHTEKEDGLVVISPAWTNGELWGEDDARVFTALADLVTEMRRQGREVAYMSCFPGDDRHIMEIMRQSNSLDARYVAAYDDHDGGLEILASAEVVVAERLHAAVVAAACGTPFVAVEYRPKIRDFARSVDQEDYVVRSDEVTSDNLAALITAVEAEGIAARLHPAVDRYRERQRRVAEQLSSLLQN